MKTIPDIVILSGLSGSGKSSALNSLEDAGYFAIDNLPGFLFPELIRSYAVGPRRKAFQKIARRIAVVMDARERDFLKNFDRYLDLLKSKRIAYRLFFFTARDDVLLRRFSETRRRHPLTPHGRVNAGIQKERLLLHPIRAVATDLIDTSHLNVHSLRREVLKRLHVSSDRGALSITVVSFGYRYGLPLEADLVQDVRFLPNPHFVPKLRPLTGLNPRVARFVRSKNESKIFLKQLNRLLSLLLRHYEKEGKSYLTLAFGCTGGRHRSVAIAESMATSLKRSGYPVKVLHRDISRED